MDSDTDTLTVRGAEPRERIDVDQIIANTQILNRQYDSDPIRTELNPVRSMLDDIQAGRLSVKMPIRQRNQARVEVKAQPPMVASFRVGWAESASPIRPDIPGRLSRTAKFAIL